VRDELRLPESDTVDECSTPVMPTVYEDMVSVAVDLIVGGMWNVAGVTESFDTYPRMIWVSPSCAASSFMAIEMDL